MDSKKHSKFTGDKASVSQKVGGKFSAFGGYAQGKNLELVLGKKIVQTWRASDWPEDFWSTTTYEFKKAGKGTKLTFTQVNIPTDQMKSIKKGWVDYYWTPMKEMFKENK